MTQLQFSLNGDKIKLSISNQDASAMVDEEIIKAFQGSEFSNFFLLTDEVSNTTALVNEKLAQSKFNSPYEIDIAERRSARVKVEMSADKMSATAQVTAPYAGKLPTVKQLINSVVNSGVTMGVDQQVLKDLAAEMANAQSGQEFVIDIAKGKLPIDGLDSQFEALTESAKERLLRPKELENGKVDMRSLGEIISVKANDPLMRRHPPTKGKAGYQVDGIALQPEPGKKMPFEEGDGAITSPDDEDLLIAEMAGLPFELEHGMRVDNVLLLTGVDVSTGHVEFEGGVVVSGDITEGMKLKATGDVTVTGFIDNADVEVEGNLTVAGGIVGRKTEDDVDPRDADYNCKISVTGTVAAKYAQYTDIKAGKDVEVISQIIHCRVHAKRLIGGTLQKPGAKVVGGDLQITELISCATLGAPASTHTYIHLFPQLDEKNEKLAEVNKMIKVKEAIIVELKMGWQHLKEMDLDDKETLMKTAQLDFKKQTSLLNRLRAAQAGLTKEIETLSSESKIVASQHVYANIHVILDKMVMHTERDYKALTIREKDGKLAKLA